MTDAEYWGVRTTEGTIVAVYGDASDAERNATWRNQNVGRLVYHVLALRPANTKDEDAERLNWLDAQDDLFLHERLAEPRPPFERGEEITLWWRMPQAMRDAGMKNRMDIPIRDAIDLQRWVRSPIADEASQVNEDAAGGIDPRD